MPDIFVYGTLQSPEIIKKLTGKSFKSSPATLYGYQLLCVKNCDYPAIIEQAGSKTQGLFIENIDDLSLAVISFYEGDEYDKRKVTVFTDRKLKDAVTFVWVKGNDLLDNEKWDFQEFEKTSLEYYLNEVIPETLEEFNRHR
jgi:gamma-glutamylcyclotransferase (GGCT)/AIG2-like uncharacterized protein YtfP